MTPPSWAVSGATRLDLKQFGTEFGAAWARLTMRFLKLECWQEYREAETNESQAAWERGDADLAEDLLRREAEADRPLYDDVRARGLDYVRIRLIRPPLTDYLRYELLNYTIRAAMGETIQVVRCDPKTALPNDDYFDFLLFDRHTALIHDYGGGPVGHQTGGWLTRDPDVVARLEVTALALRARAEPLATFLAAS
jgi:hypothetical protein